MDTNRTNRRFNVYLNNGGTMTMDMDGGMFPQELPRLLMRWGAESFPLRIELVMSPFEVNDFESLWNYTYACGRASKQLKEMDPEARNELHDFLYDYYETWGAYDCMRSVNDYRTQARTDALSDFIGDLIGEFDPTAFSDLLDELGSPNTPELVKDLVLRMVKIYYDNHGL